MTQSLPLRFFVRPAACAFALVVLATTPAPAQSAQDLVAGRSPDEVEMMVDRIIGAGAAPYAEALLEAGLTIYPGHSGLEGSIVLFSQRFGRAPTVDVAGEAPDRAVPRERVDSLENAVDALLTSWQFAEALEMLDLARDSFPLHTGLAASSGYLHPFRVGKIITRVIALALIVLTLAALLAMRQKQPLLAARIYIGSVYLAIIPVAVLAFGLVTLEEAKAGGGFSDQAPRMQHTLLIGMCAVLGALGGALISSFQLSHAKQDGSQQFTRFFFQPLNGLFLAVVMYLAFLSGNLALNPSSGTSAPPAIWTIAFLAVLTGMFSEPAIERLRQLSLTLFGASRDETVPPAPPRVHRIRGEMETPEQAVQALADQAAGKDTPEEQPDENVEVAAGGVEER